MNYSKQQLKDVMIKNSTYSRGTLKRRLLKEGVLTNVCAICDQKATHNEKPLVMVLDHINGINNDHRLENLRMLCPNCNSQQDTFAGRNNKKTAPKQYYCDCGATKQRYSKCCRPCADEKRSRRPSYEELIKAVNETNYVQAGKKYGVSDNAIRKWIKKYTDAL